MTLPATINWSADGRAIDYLDQLELPEREMRRAARSAADIADAIRTLRIRGAPAIGVAAAMGVALEMANNTSLERAAFWTRLDQTLNLLAATRPTAVNLFWALDRMRACAEDNRERTTGEIACKLYGAASAILQEDRAMCRAIGEHALTLLPEPASILTHCNAGALATAGIGTALAAVHLAVEQGRHVRVFADETRPALQGSRLTAWELLRAGVDVTVIADSVAATVMRQGKVDLVIVGADRIAANGDVVNKVGTYPLAVLARHHDLPFYVAAPSTSIDFKLSTGAAIPIEERSGDEVRRGFGKLTAPDNVPVFAPAFDLTPAELITAIITERGIHRPPYDESLRRAYAPTEVSA